MNINTTRTGCTFSCIHLQAPQTKLSIALRTTSIALGAISVLAGILFLAGVFPGVNGLSFALGCSLIGLGVISVAIGSLCKIAVYPLAEKELEKCFPITEEHVEQTKEELENLPIEKLKLIVHNLPDSQLWLLSWERLEHLPITQINPILPSLSDEQLKNLPNWLLQNPKLNLSSLDQQKLRTLFHAGGSFGNEKKRVTLVPAESLNRFLPKIAQWASMWLLESQLHGLNIEVLNASLPHLINTEPLKNLPPKLWQNAKFEPWSVRPFCLGELFEAFIEDEKKESKKLFEALHPDVQMAMLGKLDSNTLATVLEKERILALPIEKLNEILPNVKLKDLLSLPEEQIQTLDWSRVDSDEWKNLPTADYVDTKRKKNRDKIRAFLGKFLKETLDKIWKDLPGKIIALLPSSYLSNPELDLSHLLEEFPMWSLFSSPLKTESEKEELVKLLEGFSPKVLNPVLARIPVTHIEHFPAIHLQSSEIQWENFSASQIKWMFYVSDIMFSIPSHNKQCPARFSYLSPETISRILNKMKAMQILFLLSEDHIQQVDWSKLTNKQAKKMFEVTEERQRVKLQDLCRLLPVRAAANLATKLSLEHQTALSAFRKQTK